MWLKDEWKTEFRRGAVLAVRTFASPERNPFQFDPIRALRESSVEQRRNVSLLLDQNERKINRLNEKEEETTRNCAATTNHDDDIDLRRIGAHQAAPNRSSCTSAANHDQKQAELRPRSSNECFTGASGRISVKNSPVPPPSLSISFQF